MDGRSIIYFQVAQAISSFYVRQVCQYNFNIPRIPSSLSLSLSLCGWYTRVWQKRVYRVYTRGGLAVTRRIGSISLYLWGGLGGRYGAVDNDPIYWYILAK